MVILLGGLVLWRWICLLECWIIGDKLIIIIFTISLYSRRHHSCCQCASYLRNRQSLTIMCLIYEILALKSNLSATAVAAVGQCFCGEKTPAAGDSVKAVGVKSRRLTYLMEISYNYIVVITINSNGWNRLTCCCLGNPDQTVHSSLKADNQWFVKHSGNSPNQLMAFQYRRLHRIIIVDAIAAISIRRCHSLLLCDNILCHH